MTSRQPIITLATTEDERQAIYRLRYQVYVEEMQIFAALADHDNLWFTDSYDPSARLLYATANGKIVGTLRLHMGIDSPFPEEFQETYLLDRFRPAIDDRQMAILTRFMVNQEHRRSTLPFLMILEAARLTVEENVEISFCDCQPHLIKLYKRLGFRSYDCPVYNDPEFGIMVPLALLMGDLAYLKRIRSPVQPVLSHKPPNETLTLKLSDLLGNAAIRDLNSHHDGGDWGQDFGSLSAAGKSSCHIFDGLSNDDIQTIVSRGHIIECAPGDRIIRKKQTARTIFVVLSGSAEVRNQKMCLGTLGSGQIFGELSYLSASRRTADVFAGPQGAKLISLDDQKFRQFVENPSRPAAVFLLNLAKILADRLALMTATIDMSEDLSAVDSEL